MDLRLSQSIPAPRAAVEAALVDAAFVAATGSLPRVADCTLEQVERRGEVWHLAVRRRFDADLPAAARAVVDPARLTWVEYVEYDAGSHRGRHRIEPDHYPDLLTAAYTSRLTQSGPTTTRTLEGTLRVHVPLMGGAVERAIVSGLEEYTAAEADLLGRWCAGERPA